MIINPKVLELTKDQLSTYTIEQKLDLLPYVDFEDLDDLYKVLSSELFDDIFEYYKKFYFNDKLDSKTPIEQKISTYLYLTDQEQKQIDNIEDTLYWRPCPTIEEFINSDEYLGLLFKNSLYPYWKRTYSEIFAPGSAINKVIFTGSTSAGKSTAARIGVLYSIYRLICLRDPRAVLNVSKESVLSAFILSVNLKLAERTNYDPFLSILENSPCFRRVRKVEELNNFGPNDPVPFVPARSDVSIKFPNNIMFQIGSTITHTVSNNIFCSFSDEVSEKSSPVEIEKTLNLLNSIDKRLEGRFMGSNYIFQIIASSAKTSNSALGEYIKKIPKTPSFKIYNPRAWEIKNDVAFIGDGTTFPVLVGNGVIQSRILTQEEDIKQAENGTFPLENGCEILMVPTVYKKDFELNLEQSLQDIAGVATAENKLMFRDTSKLENEFLTPELNLKCELGKDNILINSLPEDMFEYTNGIERLVRYPKAPRYVHVDLAEAGGHSEAGISMCHKERYIHPVSGEAITIYVFDFIAWINAEKRIDINAVEKLWIDLITKKNVIIDSISYDQFQSESSLQSLKMSGLIRSVQKLSVDVNINPYEYFASQLELGRIKAGVCPYFKKQLHSLKLENGKVQRTTQRKDMVDSCVGSVELARRNYQDIPKIDYLREKIRIREIKYDNFIEKDSSLIEI